MNRFIQKNMFLTGFLGLAALGILFLLVVSVMQHARMREYIRNTDEMRENVAALRRQKPPAVHENIELIQKDIDGYAKSAAELRPYFGHPFRPALEAFGEELKVPSAKLIELFRSFWEKEKQTQSPRELTYRRFRADGGRLGDGKALWTPESWDQALKIFEEKAQQATLEKIDAQNLEEIFLYSLGLERNLGNSPQRLSVFTRTLQGQMVDLLNEKKVELVGVYFNSVGISPLKTDANFDDVGSRRDGSSSRSADNPSRGSVAENAVAVDAAPVIRNWEIMSDLVRRIADSGVKALEQLSFESQSGRRDGNFTVYRYEFTVRGTPQAIRSLLNALLEAYQENRVYVTRNFSIRKLEDQAQDLIDMAQGLLGAPKAESEGSLDLADDVSGGGRRGGGRTAAPEVQTQGAGYFREKGVYGEIVTGRSELCEAVIVVDYVIYSANELK